MAVVRVRSTPGGIDPYGEPVAGTETLTTLPDAFTAPRTSSDVDTRDNTGVIVGLTLFAPYGTDIAPTDEFDIDGIRYRIEGVAGEWKNALTDWEAGTTVALERAAG